MHTYSLSKINLCLPPLVVMTDNVIDKEILFPKPKHCLIIIPSHAFQAVINNP